MWCVNKLNISIVEIERIRVIKKDNLFLTKGNLFHQEKKFYNIKQLSN